MTKTKTKKKAKKAAPKTQARRKTLNDRNRSQKEWQAIVKMQQSAIENAHAEIDRMRALNAAHEGHGLFTLEPVLSGERRADVEGVEVVFRGELDRVLFVQVPEGTTPSAISSTVGALQGMGIDRPIAAIYPGFEAFRVVAVTEKAGERLLADVEAAPSEALPPTPAT